MGKCGSWQTLSVLLVGVFFAGCIAAVPAAMYVGGGAALGVGGMSVYNAANDEKDLEKLTKGNELENVPTEMLFVAPLSKTSQSVISTFLESGEQIDTATDTFIKTKKFRLTPEVGAITSLLGKSEVYATRAVVLASKGKYTGVSVSMDISRKTMWTQETQKDWPELEAELRKEFFAKLSKKIRPK